MIFDVMRWREVEGANAVRVPRGYVRVKASQMTALFVRQHGKEALFGTGFEFSMQLSAPSELHFETKGRVFVEMPASESFEPVGEVYTNIDRLPHESGTLNEVRQALLLFKAHTMEMKRQIRNEYNKFFIKKKKALAEIGLDDAAARAASKTASEKKEAEAKPKSENSEA